MENSNHKVRHTVAVTVVLFLGALLVWIIQLARSGDPIGYIILTGLGVLLALPTAGGVVALLLHAVSKLHQPPSLSRDDLKSIQEAQKTLRAHNQYLTHMLAQLQKNPLLLTNGILAEAEAAPDQTRAPAGFVVHWADFDRLDDDPPVTDEHEMAGGT